MANYSAWNSEIADCLAKTPGLPSPPMQWGMPNPCVPPPSSRNPYKVSELGDFKMDMLREVITNPYYGNNLALCYDAARLLPPTFAEINAQVDDPQRLNVRANSLRNLTRNVLPFPLNESNPAEVTTWWWNNAVNDSAGASAFISAVENNCTAAVCTGVAAVGDPDISGVGMLVSTGMLIVLAVVFATPSGFGWRSRHEIAGGQPYAPVDLSKGRRLRRALIGTLDDLIGAVILFTLSVLIAAIILRLQNRLFFDILMGETLSLVSSTAMVMVGSAYWTTYWQVDRLRPSVVLGFVVNAILTIVLFGIEFSYQHMSWALEGIPLERNCMRTLLHNVDLDELGGKRYILPVCFALWLVALLASLANMPWARAWRPRTGPLSMVAHLVGLLPLVLGTVGIILLCIMFYSSYMSMKSAFGPAFTDPQHSWGFGQFLALATWVEPFLQFVHFMFAGTREVLRSRLPWPWDVFVPEDKEVERPLAE